ncbi:hypothetical protein CTA2_3760 [Colletotrichum tanaceti]|uniref:DUF7357 domain-containing protein n=1 Tax=Colletotrichum tanaceti TaxID=1306861 RepID=A0A4U6X3I3_9PEZI|nr:hypothetical protein CTA2_3760 [Colletotrichum tanaceti]TKW49329.1 hypothetical protein CTA1_13289 [Colletotrichum tanaceti]
MAKDLRLRLVVRRHGVPDVKLLWNAAADEDLTISKLLVQVNEVLPLESGEWGLEDYAVELKDASGDGFECVHFHLVSKVLKDDDQVLIRPLLTGDLKRRRLSGRHQISVDGRHLVDGLAFGRPWLRPPRDRPAVTLPPRKKARITYGSDDDDDDGEEDSPSEDGNELPMLEYESTRANEDPASVKLRTRFYDADADADADGDSLDEEDFEPSLDAAEDDDMDSEAEAADILDELRLLRKDNADIREEDVYEALAQIQRKRGLSGSDSSFHSSDASDHSPAPPASNVLVRSNARAARHRLDLVTLDKIAALRAAFPNAQVSTIEEALLRYNKDSAKAYRKLREAFSARLSLKQTLDHQARSLSSSPIRHANHNAGRELVLRESSPSERASHGSAPHEDEEEDVENISTTLNHNTHVDSDPKSLEEGSSSDSGSDSDSDSNSSSGSSAAAAASDLDQDVGGPSDDDEDEDDSAESSSDDGGDDDDDDDDDEDDEDDSDESEGAGPVLDQDNTDSDGQENSSPDDDAGSESSASADGSATAATQRSSNKHDAISVSSSDSSSDSSEVDSSSDDSDSDSDSDSEPEEIPSKTLSGQHRLLEPSQPQQPAQIPAQAPRAAPVAAAAPAQEQADVPPGQGLSKTQKRNARRKLAKQLAAGKSMSDRDGVEPRKSALAASADEAAFLARKQALLNAIASDGPAERSSQEPQDISGSGPQEMEVDQPSIADADATETPQPSDAQAEEETAQQRRMKPNIGATRRMLMGSLGLKNPKTKADEDRIRQDLMKGVRPHTNTRLTEAAPHPGESSWAQKPVEEDPEAWREKIAYRAVECCHDGIELSEPPFPFVQRWDPQQQVEEWFGSKNKRGGKRKRVQRNQAQYYEDGDSQVSKKRRVTGESFGVTFSDAVESLEEGDTTLNYDDPPDEEPTVAKATAEGSQATDIDDLPSLPSDLNILPDLRPGEAKLGMVITWKKWLLSSATNWQPQVASLTGILVRVHDEEAMDLEFLLARRDRNVGQTEKKYDEDTGERIYDRFEAPDDDDDEVDDEPDQGYRRLNYTDLIEPKILQLPLEDQAAAAGKKDSSAAPTDSIIHETVYDGHAEPFHMDAETPGQSEAPTDGSQLLVNAKDGQAKANTDDAQPQLVIDSNPQLDSISGDDHNGHDTSGMQIDSVENIHEENMPTPRMNSGSRDEPPAPTMEEADSQSSNRNDFSISSDRRHEISIMIQEAGFRQDISPSVIRRKTSSPSRQLLDMQEAAGASRVVSKSPLSQESMIGDGTLQAGNEVNFAVGVTDDGEEAVAPLSSASSVRSGRQLDPDDYSFNMGDDLPQISDTGDCSFLDADASTPKAGAQTPTRAQEGSAAPSSDESFPSLESLARTASQQNLHKHTQSPSQSQVASAIASRKPIVQCDDEYEAAMRLVDEARDEDEEEERDELPQISRSTRQRLFPNSSQPDPSSLSDSVDLPDIKPALVSTTRSSSAGTRDIKPRLRRREPRESPFLVPTGSQVFTLSSSPPSSPPQESYAEDSIDADYEGDSIRSSLRRSSRASSRAMSVPAKRRTTGSASARGPIPPSSLPARPGASGRRQRKPSPKF